MLIDPELLLRLIDLGGVLIFALSGGLLAVRHDMDLFGIIVVSFLPAIGGGTLRDLLLDQSVFWLTDNVSLAFAFLGGLLRSWPPVSGPA